MACFSGTSRGGFRLWRVLLNGSQPPGGNAKGFKSRGLRKWHNENALPPSITPVYLHRKTRSRERRYGWRRVTWGGMRARGYVGAAPVPRSRCKRTVGNGLLGRQSTSDEHGALSGCAVSSSGELKARCQLHKNFPRERGILAGIEQKKKKDTLFFCFTHT